MPVIEIDGVGDVEFPESMSSDDIASAADNLYLQANFPAEHEALSQTESDRGVPQDAETLRLNPRQLLESPERGAWQKFRGSDWGRRLFGPTEIEREVHDELGTRGRIGVMEVPSKMLEFTSVPPPAKGAVKATIEALNPLQVFGPKGEAVGKAVGELAANFPIAPLGGGVVGKTALGLFAGEYAAALPDAREAYKQALEAGDAPKAIEIATQTMLGGALLGVGAFHAAKSRPEAVATKTQAASERSAEILKEPAKSVSGDIKLSAEIIKEMRGKLESRADAEAARQLVNERQPANKNAIWAIARDFTERIGQLSRTTEAQIVRAKIIRKILESPTEASAGNLADMLGLKYDPTSTGMPQRYNFVKEPDAAIWKEPVTEGSFEHQQLKPELMRQERVVFEKTLKEVREKRAEGKKITPAPSIETKAPQVIRTEESKGGAESERPQEKIKEEVLTKPPPVPPASEASGQRIGIIPEGMELTMDTIGNQSWWNRYFTSERGLPSGVPKEWTSRMGEIRAETREAAYGARDLANALREEYGISAAKMATGGLSSVPKPTMDSIQRVLTGQADINTLPERVRAPVQKIRDHVDSLSNQMMDALGMDNPLTAKIGDNLGVYLTRSYRIFDDPKWVKKIPVEARNQAESFLADQLAGQRGLPAGTLRQEARTKLNEMLADWSDNGLDKLMRQGKLGSKDISLFMRRKDIAPEIRAVMGEYGDPITNYIRSVTKMSRWLGDQKFLNKVKELGVGKWLFEEGQQRPSGFDHLLASEDSATMSPLNGLRTSEGIKQVFEEFNKSQLSDNFFARGYFAINAWSKMSKTVFSALTQARNFIGNPFFNIKSGHFNFKDYGTAFKTQFADIAGSNNNAQEFYKEMARHGLVDENPVVNELRATIQDAGLRDPSFENYSMNGAARALRLAISAPQRAYRLPDEMGKTVGWIAEQADLRSAHPDWSPDRVKQEAATRVRNEYPTYSMIPEALQQFRKQPVFGPFVNFAYETVRNSYWTLRNGSTDLFTGENAAQRRHGAKKLAGFGTVLASGTGLSMIGNQIFNIQSDADDDIRRFLPDYARNAELLIYDKDATRMRFVNYSYLNPYSQFTDAWVAAMNGDEKGILDRSASAFGELIRPFSDEQILASALLEWKENRDSGGNQIYNPQAEGNEQIGKVADHLLRAITPGSVDRFRKRIWPAMTGDPWPSGEERSVATEVFSELTGIRFEQRDLSKILGYKVREFYNDDLRNARKLATDVILSSKQPSIPDGLRAYKAGDDARFRLWQTLYRDVSAVIRQGANSADAFRILDSGGLSKADATQLVGGRYSPLNIDADDFKRANRTPDPELLRQISEERAARSAKTLEP